MSEELSAAEVFRRAREADEAAAAPPADRPFAGMEGDSPPIPPPARRPPWQGSMLPIATDEHGSVSFDPNAGLLGEFKKPFDWAYGVRTGTIPADPRNPEYIGGAANTALTYGPGSAASRYGTGKVTAPSVEAHDASSAARFKAFRDSNQIFAGDDYRAYLKQTVDDLEKTSHYAENAGTSHTAIARELERVKNHPFVDTKDVDAFRTALDASNLKDKDLSGMMKARESLYSFLEKHGDENVRKAVGDYRQARHSEAVTAPGEATSQKNIAKAQGPELSAEQTRMNIANLINSRKGRGPKGFSETEMNILKDANKATPWIDRAQNIGDRLKLTSKTGGLTPASFTAGGGGLGALGALIADKPGPALTAAAVGTGAALTGWGARTLANRGARRIADEADNAIRSQSPLARETFATAPNTFSAVMPGVGGGVGRTGYSVMANPAIAAAVSARLREGPPAKDIPQQYRVLPDGTVEEFM